MQCWIYLRRKQTSPSSLICDLRIQNYGAALPPFLLLARPDREFLISYKSEVQCGQRVAWIGIAE